MSRFHSFAARHAGALGAFAALLLYSGTVASAQEGAAPPASEPGRIEFDHPGAARATVEVDLTRGMFGDLFGIGDAFLAGATEALSDSPQAREGVAAVQQAAAQTASMRELVSIAQNAINDVRVRVYEGANRDGDAANSAIAHYDQKLQATGWDQAIRVQDGDDAVRISTLRADGAIRGVFVIAGDGSDLVLVNVTCDISPEIAKKLSSTAVKSGLQAGLDKHLEKAMKHMKK